MQYISLGIFNVVYYRLTICYTLRKICYMYNPSITSINIRACFVRVIV